MLYVQLIILFLFAAGTLLILGLTPKEFAAGAAGIVMRGKSDMKAKPLKKQLEAKNKKRRNILSALITDARSVILYGGMAGGMRRLFVLSGMCAAMGITIAALLKNIYLVPTLGLGFASVPFIYLKIMGHRIRHALNDELETALSIVTTTYIRCEDIVQAVGENIDYIGQPVKGTFQKFLVNARYINSNIPYLLEKMKDEINNEIFGEWIDVLVTCQNDKNKKHILNDIVGKLSDVRIVSAELDNLMYAPVKEFISLVIMFCLLPVLLYFSYRDWFDILFYTGIGKITFSVCILVLVTSMFGAVNATKPVEYRR